MTTGTATAAGAPLELWGGLECTINRVRDTYFNQLERSGHAAREDDLPRFAALGIRRIRYPVLWEALAPDGAAVADWRWADRIAQLQRLGLEPILGLVHHGSGPPHTNLLSPCFPTKLADYARALAQRCPSARYFTPVNEPLTTARFSALYGLWYPHARDDRQFVRAVLHQCRATVLSMRAIRQVLPDAQLIQTDDLGKTYGTDTLEAAVTFYNERRWLAWDLLCGKVDAQHPLWSYLRATGVDAGDILWFQEHPCPPDVIGINYYVTSERWLDHRTERFPSCSHGSIGGRPAADIETARVLATPTPGIAPLLQEAWERYAIPLAVTEAHLGGHREDQLRWLLEIWEGAQEARASGVDVRAVTAWALLGSFDWNSLVTRAQGYYEPGAFDVRSTPPRPTALARLIGELARNEPLRHPLLRGQGWWRRADRLVCLPVATRAAPTSISADGHSLVGKTMQPILIAGATGTLGQAFARLCARRNIACQVLTRAEMDIADPLAVARALARYRPWAVINACGYVRVDEAEHEIERCFRDNTVGPTILAAACAGQRLQLLTFSSDLVFDGALARPYCESDAVRPLSAYGRSKACAEAQVLDRHPESLIVRTSSFFGPWDRYNFVTETLRTLARGGTAVAAHDITVSPTYVPDLVDACLDLLIDGATGIWHLSNGTAVTWSAFARAAAEQAGMGVERVRAVPSVELGFRAPRPVFSALASERGVLLPALDDALGRYLTAVRGAAIAQVERSTISSKGA